MARHENSPRAGETAEGPTDKENPLAAPSTIQPDQQALERFDGWVSDLEDAVGKADAKLAKIDGFLDEGLPQSLAKSIKNRLAGIKELVPSLRDAARVGGEES